MIMMTFDPPQVTSDESRTGLVLLWSVAFEGDDDGKWDTDHSYGKLGS